MIGVVAPESAAAFADALDAPATVGPAEEIVEVGPDAVVAVGERAAIDLARAGVDAPVLPVAAGRGLASVTRERALGVLDRLVAGEYATRSYPVLEVSLGEAVAGRALFDAMLVTSDPGQISEYGVRAPDLDERFRADGVVVATPAGSYGYANAAGGPVLERGAGLLAVVPVAAFAVRTDRWVLDRSTPLALTVEREVADVSLLLDDREQRAIPLDRPVGLTAPDDLAVVRFPDGNQLEKL